MIQILVLLCLILMPKAALATDANLTELAAVPRRPGSDILGGIAGCDNAQKIVIVTCRPYSVVGDSSTDDTAALQAVIDAAPDFLFRRLLQFASRKRSRSTTDGAYE